MKKYPLDSSFLIDLLIEMAADREGPALAWLRHNPKAQLWISPVTLTEVLEEADDARAANAYFGRLGWESIACMRKRFAALQKRGTRRMGENDAWQCAVAERMGAVVVRCRPRITRFAI